MAPLSGPCSEPWALVYIFGGDHCFVLQTALYTGVHEKRATFPFTKILANEGRF